MNNAHVWRRQYLPLTFLSLRSEEMQGQLFLPVNNPTGGLRSLYPLSGRTELIPEPVLQFPNAQCGIHESFGSGKTIVVRNLAVIDFLSPCLLDGTGPLFSGRSRPSAKTPLQPSSTNTTVTLIHERLFCGSLIIKIARQLCAGRTKIDANSTPITAHCCRLSVLRGR